MRDRSVKPLRSSPRSKTRPCRPRVEAMEARWLPAPLLAGLPAVVARPAALVATTTTTTSSANPSAGDQNVTFTVTVAAPPGSTAAPTGMVALFDGAAEFPNPSRYLYLTPVPGTATSTASFGIEPFAENQANFPHFPGAGPQAITATYSGDATYAASTSAPFNQVVGRALLPSGLNNLSGTPVVGQPITLTAFVSSRSFGSRNGSHGPVLTGTFSFFDGGKLLSTVPAIPSGSFTGPGASAGASFTIPSLTAGPHSYSMTYSGDANYLPTSASTSITSVEPSHATLVASTNPSILGQPVLFTATVAGPPGGGTPTGYLTYGVLAGTNPPSSGAAFGGYVSLDASGHAVIGIVPPTAGAYSVSIAYHGDARFTTTGAATTLYVIFPARATLAGSPGPATAGHPVTFTATVIGSTGVAPSGTVLFKDGARTLGTAQVNVAGRAAFTTAALAAGNHEITAFYEGGGGFAPATSAAVTQVVKPAPAVKPAVVDGPRVARVQRFGVRGQLTAIVITFNGPLNPATARNLANYALIGPSPSTRAIPIASAVYDPARQTVTLRPARKLDVTPRLRYTLDVRGSRPGGVADTAGRPIDGARTGRPGSDFVASFSGL